MSSRLMPPNPGAIASVASMTACGRLRIEAERIRVDAGELLEDERLAFHHRQRTERADVAEPENRGAVSDDGDRGAFGGQRPGRFGSRGDGRGHPRHSRRVGHRHVLAGAQLSASGHLDLAAQVIQERRVGGVPHLDARLGFERRGHLVHVIFVERQHGEVDGRARCRDVDEVHPGHDTAGLADDLGEPGQQRRVVRREHAHRHRVAGARRAAGARRVSRRDRISHASS